MKRTTAEANDANRYSEGNPSLGIPATVVGAEEMNNIQEEIVNVVLDAGLTLNASDEDQLLEAINIKLAGGGTASGQINQSLVNNQASPAVVTGLIFNKVVTKAFRVLFDIQRSTSLSNLSEVGELFGKYNSITDTWSIHMVSHGDDAQTTFSIDSSGQVLYATNNMAGTSYAGNARFHNIFKVKI